MIGPLMLAAAQMCRLPASVPTPHAELPSQSEPARTLPIASYTLAVSWSPEHCFHAGDAATERFQCGEGRRFGFTLHGLWPDGPGKVWPQYCRPTPILLARTIRPTMCATPSAQLIQHEWAKHGTCIPGDTPDRYFARERRLYRALRFPDMARLAAGPLTVGAFATAFAAANRGMTADMLRVTTTKDGWLSEVWLCRDLALKPRRCPGNEGADASQPLRIRVTVLPQGG